MRSLFKNIISTLLLLLLTSALLQAQQEGGTPLQGRVLSASTGNPIAEVPIPILFQNKFSFRLVIRTWKSS